MLRLILISSLLILFSCKEGKKSELEFYEIKTENFSSYVNPKKLPVTPNLSVDKYLVNNDYPIEIALYNDNKFYYNLPNLGDGKGTWNIEDGIVKLNAKRKLFDMYIEIQAMDSEIKDVVLKFRDRFGPKVLQTQKDNF